MDFLSFLERSGLADETALSLSVSRRVAAVMQQAPSLAAVLENGPTEAVAGLTPDELRALGHAHRRWRRWRDALSSLPEDHPLYETAATCTTRPDELHLLGAVDIEPEQAQPLLELWAECLQLGRQQGHVRVDAGEKLGGKGGRPLQGSPWAELVGMSLSVDGLQAKTWLGIRHGTRRGALTYSLQVPADAVRRSAAGEGEEAGALLDAIVPALSEGLIESLDQQSQEATLRLAADRYLGVLRARPVRSDRIVAVYVGRARDPVGLAMLGREGREQEHTVLQPGPDWGQRLERFFSERRPEHAVLPSEAPAERLLAEVARRLPPRLPTTRVRRAALDLARRTLPDLSEGLPPVVQAAVALGRRAIDPNGEWSRLDPAELDLVPFQGDLDPEAVREGLVEARLARAAGAPPRPARTPAVPALGGPEPAQRTGGGRRRVVVEAPRARYGRSRPPVQRKKVQVVGEEVEVRSLDDLRSGMLVKGTVTNTSRFGAFVSMGLSDEGLIHVSELADHYVADPAEVVTVGQDVTARVLQVDTDRRRVALSLKGVTQEPADPEAAAGPPPRGGIPQNRSEALAELNRLFSKDD